MNNARKAFLASFAMAAGLLAFAAPLVAQSGPAYLVKDIYPGWSSKSYALEQYGGSRLTPMGNYALFARWTPFHGIELWRTDGTNAGTYLVKDTLPGQNDGVFNTPVNVNGTAFFKAMADGHGIELWKTDGTMAGTVMVKDIWPGPSHSLYTDAYFTNVNGTLFFRAYTPQHGLELWKSDGTEKGTVLVRDILPGRGDSGFPGGMRGFYTPPSSVPPERAATSAPSQFACLDGKLIFLANDGRHGYELWTSDGTTGGTKLLKDINPGEGSITERDYYWSVNIIIAGKIAYFSADDGVHGMALWKTDGTEGGTVLVKDIRPSSGLPGLYNGADGVLYFSATDGIHGDELWKTDGTALGTVLVKDIWEGTRSSSPGSTYGPGFCASNGTIFFTAWSQHNCSPYDWMRRLWKTDGTEAGTVIVDINTDDVRWLTNFNGTLFFSAHSKAYGQSLWKSDGTSGGTVMVKDIDPRTNIWEYPSYFNEEVIGPWGLMAVNGRILFWDDDDVHSIELWRSDGTAGGTELVQDTVVWFNNSSPRSFTDVEGTLFFGTYRSELYRSDGTSSGTTLVKQGAYANGAYLYLDPYLKPNFVNSNGTIYFIGGNYFRETGEELWKTDGTPEGTVMVKDIVPGIFSSLPSYLTMFGETLIFGAYSQYWRDAELWRSDGTETGTILIKDIQPGIGSSKPRYFTELNGKLYFFATDTLGTGLWMTDGTEAGTKILARVSVDGPLVKSGQNLFFSAYEKRYGWELWKSDGTAAGTGMVKDITPGPYSSLEPPGSPPPVTGPEEKPGQTGGASSSPQRFVDVNGVLFFTALDRGHGWELWKSDGTQSGTHLVSDIAPGEASSSPNLLINVKGTLFFHCLNEDTGWELWKSDGTKSGTRMVKDINPGPDSGDPMSLAAVGDLLVFAASDGQTGLELWRSDGTESGTMLVQDIAAGSDSSWPDLFTLSGSKVYFRARDNSVGDELWAINYSILAGQPGQALQELIRMVNELGAAKEIRDSLKAELETASEAFQSRTRTSDVPVMIALDAFVSKVERKQGIEISNNKAEAMTLLARQIRELLEK